MKNLILIALTLVLALSLAACGASQPAQSNETPATTEAVRETTGAAETTEAVAPIDLAKSCIDLPVSDLIALIGEPQSSDYAPSCLNPGQGEDGMLYYDGFVVYTYKEGDTETVQDVE